MYLPIGMFSEKFHSAEPTHSEYGWYHIMDWGYGLNKQEKISWAATSTSSCFLDESKMWPVALHIYGHNFPTILDYIPSYTLRQNKLFLAQVALYWVFGYSDKKSN